MKSRRWFLQQVGVSAASLLVLPKPNWAMHSSMELTGEMHILNPTKFDFNDAIVKLKEIGANEPATYKVYRGGTEIPSQVEYIAGKKYLWACVTVPAQSSQTFSCIAGRPSKFSPKVSLQKKGHVYEMQNEFIRITLPAIAQNGIPGPIVSITLADGKQAARSFWVTEKKLKSFSAKITGDGTIFAKLRLRYEFYKTGANAAVGTAYSEIDIMLAPEWRHVVITERHEMEREDYWLLEMSAGWNPTSGISKQFNNGPGGDSNYQVPPMNRPLLPVENRSFSPNLYISLLPRWNQHFKDGWAFAATNQQQHLSAVAVKASLWKWPHDNSLHCLVKQSGNYAAVQCPTWHGERTWWLSPSLLPMDTEYIAKYAWEDIDKINNEFVLDWPSKNVQWWSINPYNSTEINPTHTIRQIGKAAVKNAGKEPDDTTLIRFQTLMHPDCYGSYWNYFSPENPNFFTDYYLVPIALATNLKQHPRFNDFRQQAEQKFLEDLHHSITLPGGAGQECPGYGHYAMSLWREIAAMGKEHLGFKMDFINTRFAAAENFYKRVSYPDGKIRRGSPVGDSHPDRGGVTGMPVVSVDTNVVSKWETEELPGFGVLFCNKPGTEKETYLSFKSGPNRCHYHGDQLSFHYCANARPLVVDHHCSYHPRAGQEHMHNRMAFFTNEMDYANMDGYERIVAFKTSKNIDVTIGQVESIRLRKVEQFPPEIWDARFPQLQFNRPLVYRRTVILMKNGPVDYFIFRDQFWADRPINAAFCLHTYGNSPVKQDHLFDFGNLFLYCNQPDVIMKKFDWEHENGGKEVTKGIRLETTAQAGDIFTVLYPGNVAPVIKNLPGGIQVGDDEILFNQKDRSSEPSTEAITISKGKQKVFTLFNHEINLNRSQGEIGLFIPDAGYPFGDIPEWLIKQRASRPAWAKPPELSIKKKK